MGNAMGNNEHGRHPDASGTSAGAASKDHSHSFSNLCEIEHLHHAYDQVKDKPRQFNLDAQCMQMLGEHEVQFLLTDLSRDLRSETYRPGCCSAQLTQRFRVEESDLICLRD